MAYSSLIRARAEAILCDGYGTTRTLAAGRFRRHADADREPSDVEASAADRKVKVRVRNPTDLLEVNTTDGIRFETLSLDVQVSYALTDAGDDLVEGTGEQHGPGTLEAIEDRSTVDAADVRYALDWYESWASIDSNVTVIWCKRAGPTPPVETTADVATLTVPFEVLVQVTQTTLAP